MLIYPISAPLLFSSPFSPLFVDIAHNSSSRYRFDLILTDPSKDNSGFDFITTTTINVHEKTTAYSYRFSSAPTLLSTSFLVLMNQEFDYISPHSHQPRLVPPVTRVLLHPRLSGIRVGVGIRPHSDICMYHYILTVYYYTHHVNMYHYIRTRVLLHPPRKYVPLHTYRVLLHPPRKYVPLHTYTCTTTPTT